MTNSLTDINPVDIITHVEQNFNRSQATGLNSLIFLALREQTTVGHQRKEWGFEDIPEQIVAWCDELEDEDLLEVATAIATGLLDEITTISMFTENAQNYTAQSIDDQKQPTLLSDY
ncbi:MAG: hypothetical protein HWQ35_14270 [Nostoc sp. NMS1]|uniref:hypothetical protein n=1 Tax=unclassified Nostoc TaxID=2593658 RepID=UPI0025E27EC5|nr:MULTISPECIES: hypothetical protein [unclassified Nostoc]MBN3907674.1 hypothetical protein [Nostoc sp. NMS1]MBN3992961.1 hypothetical protein [Nostoc sp. NMS2]